jgi:hypothetical protein
MNAKDEREYLESMLKNIARSEERRSAAIEELGEIAEEKGSYEKYDEFVANVNENRADDLDALLDQARRYLEATAATGLVELVIHDNRLACPKHLIDGVIFEIDEATRWNEPVEISEGRVRWLLGDPDGWEHREYLCITDGLDKHPVKLPDNMKEDWE